MRVFTERVGAGSAVVTGYLLDESDELLNARPRLFESVLHGDGCRDGSRPGFLRRGLRCVGHDAHSVVERVGRRRGDCGAPPGRTGGDRATALGFEVDDLDAALELDGSLGGRVVDPPLDRTGEGVRIAQLADTEANIISIAELKR